MQGEYIITGDQLRVSHVAVGLIARPPNLPVRAYAQLFDETATSIVTIDGDTLTVATADYTLTLRATTPKPELTPTLLSPSPRP